MDILASNIPCVCLSNIYLRQRGWIFAEDFMWCLCCGLRFVFALELLFFNPAPESATRDEDNFKKKEIANNKEHKASGE